MNQTQRIPVVALTIDKSVTRFNEFDISNKVREKGWILSAYSMPQDAQQINSLRIVIRPHMNRDVSEILANDIEEACEYLDRHGGSATPRSFTMRSSLYGIRLRKCAMTFSRVLEFNQRAQFILTAIQARGGEYVESRGFSRLRHGVHRGPRAIAEVSRILKANVSKTPRKETV